MDKLTLTVAEASKLLGMSQDSLRAGLRQGNIPWGMAYPASEGRGFRYIISKKKLYKFLGLEENKDES